MSNLTASSLYVKSSGRVCSLCKGRITHRRPFPSQRKIAFTIPRGYSDLRVKVASCRQGHEWVEIYDGRNLRTAFGNASTFHVWYWRSEVEGTVFDTDWQELYKVALFELNPAKLVTCIEAARQAIAQQDSRADITKREHHKLQEALSMLKTLSRVALPPGDQAA